MGYDANLYAIEAQKLFDTLFPLLDQRSIQIIQIDHPEDVSEISIENHSMQIRQDLNVYFSCIFVFDKAFVTHTNVIRQFYQKSTFIKLSNL